MQFWGIYIRLLTIANSRKVKTKYLWLSFRENIIALTKLNNGPASKQAKIDNIPAIQTILAVLCSMTYVIMFFLVHWLKGVTKGTIMQRY